MPVIPKGLSQAYATQDASFNTLIAYSKAIESTGKAPTTEQVLALAALITAWDKAQERVRIHRRVPLPGTARPPAAGKRKVARAAPSNVHPSAPAPQPQPPPDVA